MKASRSAGAIALVATACATIPARAAVPVCGADELRMADGTVISAYMYRHDRAEVTLRFPIATRHIRSGPIRFAGDSELELEFRWPIEDFAEQVSFRWSEMTENGREAEGTLQFECGSRNMGLVNFEVSFGQPSHHAPPEDIVDCIRELERDGTFRVALDQGNVPQRLLSGRISVRAARRRASQHIERELAREAAGLCEVLPQPPLT